MSFCFKRILLFTLPLLSSLALIGQKSTDRAFSRVMGEADEHYYYDANKLKAAELYSALLESNRTCQPTIQTWQCYLSIDGKRSNHRATQRASKNMVVGNGTTPILVKKLPWTHICISSGLSDERQH